MEREKRMGWYKLRITKRETLYVDDEAEHTVSLVETVGEPIDFEPGVAGEFVSRRTITIQDHIRGSGPIHGYVMADFQHGSVYSRFEGHRDATAKTSTGTWKSYKATGKLTGIEGEGRFKVTAGEKEGEFILEFEGEYVAA